MNDPLSEIASRELPAMPHKDRSGGLVAFGVMTLVMGVIVALFIPLMFIGQAMAAKTTNRPNDFATILPAIVIYGTMAVALVWLGIGSIKARRWARALMLIFSWSWLVTGVFVVTIMAFVLPKMLSNIPATAATNGQPAMPQGMVTTVLVFSFAIYGVIFIVMPTIWTIFYQSRHVKATCDVRDPVTRWTDACPLPVLGLCLWFLFTVPMMLIIPLTGHCVMPFFGVFLSGLPGALVCLAIAAIWAYSAWLLYRLDTRGWWLVLIATSLFMASSMLTFAQHDMMEMYRLMGYPDSQIQQIQQTGLMVGNQMNWWTALSMLPFLGYLIFIKRYFPSNKKQPV